MPEFDLIAGRDHIDRLPHIEELRRKRDELASLTKKATEEYERAVQYEIDSLLLQLAQSGCNNPPGKYTVTVTQENIDMANGITAGASGVFNAVLQDNGSTIGLPTGSTWAWSTSDPEATVTPALSDPTGATVEVSIPAGDAATSITITASTVDPTGATQSGAIKVPVTAEPQKFTVAVTQQS